VNAIAAEYGKVYENATQFVSCGCCGDENSPEGMLRYDAICGKEYNLNGLGALYKQQVDKVLAENVDTYAVKFE